MRSLIVKSPAKVNLGLNIVSKREDGFHNLKTIFYPIIDLYDDITFKTSSKLKLICDSPIPELSNNNLILKTVELLESRIKTHWSWWKGVSVHDIQYGALEDWMRHLQRSGLHPSSVVATLSGLRAMFKWLRRRQELRPAEAFNAGRLAWPVLK